MLLGRQLQYVVFSLCLGLTVISCAAMEVRTEGQGRALRWHATDFRQYTMAMEKREVYEYILVLEELQGETITFTTLQAQFRNNVQSLRSDWKRSGQWVLPAGGELRIPLGTYRHCRSDHCRDWGSLAPIWHLVLTGTNEHGQSIREVIEMSLPSITKSS